MLVVVVVMRAVDQHHAATTPAPQMMSGAFQLGGGVKPEPMKAFVVTDEMSNSQSAELCKYL
jgi:hypothetical protein